MYSLVNVVSYDGCDSKVNKFILPTVGSQVTEQGKKDTVDYCTGLEMGECLKFDVLYPMTLIEIVALQMSDDEYEVAFDRFNNMYFK